MPNRTLGPSHVSHLKIRQHHTPPQQRHGLFQTHVGWCATLPVHRSDASLAGHAPTAGHRVVRSAFGVQRFLFLVYVIICVAPVWARRYCPRRRLFSVFHFEPPIHAWVCPQLGCGHAAVRCVAVLTREVEFTTTTQTYHLSFRRPITSFFFFKKK